MASNLPQEIRNKKIFDLISKELPNDKWFQFGVQLGLNSNTLSSLEKDAIIHQYGQEYKTIRMMEKWKQEKSPNDEEVVELLREALQQIGCNDLANKINTDLMGSHEQDEGIEVMEFSPHSTNG